MINRSELASVFAQFSKETHISVTEQAQQLIIELINCVEADSHETWQPQKDRLEPYYHQWRTDLPNTLQRIAKEHGLSKR